MSFLPGHWGEAVGEQEGAFSPYQMFSVGGSIKVLSGFGKRGATPAGSRGIAPALFVPRKECRKHPGRPVVAAWVQPPEQPALSLCQPSHSSFPLWPLFHLPGMLQRACPLSSQRQVCLEQSRAGPRRRPGFHTSLLPEGNEQVPSSEAGRGCSPR